MFTEEQRAAQRAADALLQEYLTEAQRQTWLIFAYFDVRVPIGQRRTLLGKRKRYRIYRIRRHGSTLLVDQQGNPLGFCCVIPRRNRWFGDIDEFWPGSDIALAQKLLLEASEKDFLLTAVFTPHMREHPIVEELVRDRRRMKAGDA